MSLKSILICIPSFFFLTTAPGVPGAQPKDACALPRSLEMETLKKFPDERVLSLADLDQHDRALFQKEHGVRCPGLVNVDFYGDGKPTLALVLIAGKVSKHNVELVVAHQIADGWAIRSLERTDGTAVVWREDPGIYRDVYGEKTIRATHPVIVFCGYESWAIVYVWNGGTVEKVWISD